MNSLPPIREWARQNGFQVAGRGRLSPAVHAAYRAAGGHPAEPPASAAACACGRRWTALREAHCPVCHRHFSTARWFDAHRKGMGRTGCLDPATIPDRDGRPMFKVVDSAWGELVVLAKERPDDIDNGEETLL